MIQKSRIFNSPFLGIYIKTGEKYTFVPKGIEEELKGLIEETLGTKTVEVSIGGSTVIGSLMAINSHGAVLSNISDQLEIKAFPSDLRVTVINSNLNAFGNNILVNDKLAIVHEEYSIDTIKEIEDALNVEVIRSSFHEIKTVGSSGLITAKGLILPPFLEEEEVKEFESLFGTKARVGTANFGSVYVGASVVANSKGALVGEDSTPIEVLNIEEALDL